MRRRIGLLHASHSRSHPTEVQIRAGLELGMNAGPRTHTSDRAGAELARAGRRDRRRREWARSGDGDTTAGALAELEQGTVAWAAGAGPEPGHHASLCARPFK